MAVRTAVVLGPKDDVTTSSRSTKKNRQPGVPTFLTYLARTIRKTLHHAHGNATSTNTSILLLVRIKTV